MIVEFGGPNSGAPAQGSSCAPRTEPSGIKVLQYFAPSQLAPVAFAPTKSDSLRSVPEKSAPLMSAPEKTPPRTIAFFRDAP